MTKLTKVKTEKIMLYNIFNIYTDVQKFRVKNTTFSIFF